MTYKLRKTKTLMAKAREILRAIPRVKGEWRTIYACGDCGHLWGHQYIPYGAGRGRGTQRCMCQLTGHRPMLEVMTAKP